MNILQQLIDFIIHLDKYLNLIIAEFGIWTYVILFLIITAETGLVLIPFLPGDSLLFAAGIFAAVGSLNVILLFIIFSAAAIIGDSINYSIGKYFGHRLFKEHSRILKKEYLDKTHSFYERHGKKTIVLARFVPIVRTFAPFVAGVGNMSYNHFFAYNVIGGILWVAVFLFAGYFFGAIPAVQENFTVVILGVIALSVIPVIWEIVRHNLRERSSLHNHPKKK